MREGCSSQFNELYLHEQALRPCDARDLRQICRKVSLLLLSTGPRTVSEGPAAALVQEGSDERER